MPRISIQDLESCNELVIHLITLRSILKDTVKIEKILELEVKKLEQKKINELRLLEEEIFIMILGNKHLGRSSYDIDEKEIDLREQAKRKIDEIKGLKEDVKWESKAAKILYDLSYEKNDEIAAIADKIQNIKRTN